MFYRDNGRVFGVLCDWDLADSVRSLDDHCVEEDNKAQSDLPRSPVKAEANVDLNDEEQANLVKNDDDDDTFSGESELHDTVKEEQQRIGTGPFMAIELLVESKPPVHLYRHDLESFFYLLVYTCAVFKPKEHEFGHLAAWGGSDLSDIGWKKRNFFIDIKIWDATFRNTDPSYRPLVDSWITHLRGHFAKIQGLSYIIQSDRSARLGYLRRNKGKKITKYDQEIAMSVRKRDQAISYEKFMQILGAEADITH